MKKLINNNIPIYARNSKPDSKISEFKTDSVQFFIAINDVLKLTGFERKRLYLYLFRNKGISKSEFSDKKLVDLHSMLEYFGNTIRMLEAKQKNKKSS